MNELWATAQRGIRKSARTRKKN